MFMSSMEFDLGDDVKAMREAVHRWSQDSLNLWPLKLIRIIIFRNTFGEKWVIWVS